MGKRLLAHDNSPMPEAIVGRTEELATIGRFVTAAADEPRALVIAGEPGIGEELSAVVERMTFSH